MRYTNNNVVELNEINFKREVLGAQQPVLVQFWANWSQPCRAMTPVLESVAEDESTTVKVGRVDLDHNEELAEQYGVRCVPTVLIFKDGGLQDQIIGRATEQEVRTKLESLK